ncbi:MAG: hypothetical protein AAGD38_17750, partial [Acidobacteriota bacterium]
LVEKAGSSVAGVAEQTVETADRLARSFFTGDVTEQFLSSLPEIEGAGAGRLELATLDATETFTRREEHMAMWDLVPLGASVTEIRVPVTYRYHLDLAGDWRVEVADGIAIVHAPSIRPSQPPAIHTDRLEKHVEADWLLADDAQAQLEEMERSLTPRLTRRAQNPKHVDLVRDEARRTVGAFIKQWLLREEQWGLDGVRAIKVLFADEVDIDPSVIAPSIVETG